MKNNAREIVSRVCNEHKNSDLRADDNAILSAIDTELSQVSRKVAEDCVFEACKYITTKWRQDALKKAIIIRYFQNTLDEPKTAGLQDSALYGNRD